jgi:chromosome partitioning protein
MRERIRQGLKRLIPVESLKYSRGQRWGTVIAVSSQKGGVGKTTSAVSLGAALARFHQRPTLIIDMDAQGHVEKSLKAHLSNSQAKKTLSEVLLESNHVDVLDAVIQTSLPELHITGADPGLTETEGLMTTKIAKEFLLRDGITFARTHYDYIIIDCPPNLGNLTLNALVAADYVISPCDASPLAIQGVEDLINVMVTINRRLNRNLDLLGVLLTRLDRRNSTINEIALEQLGQEYGDLLLNSTVGVTTALAKAQFEGRSIFEFSSRCRVALQYRALAKEVINRLTLLNCEEEGASGVKQEIMGVA